MSGCLFKLSDERYVKVVNSRGEWKIEIATFKGKKGIRLTTSQYQIFTEIVGDIEKSKGYDFGYGCAAGVPEPHPIHILGQVKNIFIQMCGWNGVYFQASQYMNGYHFHIKSISMGYLFHQKKNMNG